MAISTDYPTPVYVNGYACRNCTDVDTAKKHIDPQHPKSGPYNVNAATDPTRRLSVIFGGVLSGLNGVARGANPQSAALSVSNQVDLSA